MTSIEENIRRLCLNQIEHIEESGFSMMGVFGGIGGPGFTYTMGLYRLGAPELIIYGMNSDQASHFCWTYFKKVKEGWRPQDWEVSYDFAQNLPACFRTVRPESAHETLTFADWHAAREGYPPVEAVAMVWTDKAGLFPWDPGFDETFRRHQPDVWVKISDRVKN